MAFAQDTSTQSPELVSLQSLQASFRQVAQKVMPSVVLIDVIDVVKQDTSDTTSPFDFFFNPFRRDEDEKNPFNDREFERSGLGSGVIVRRTGNQVYVLTNNHVVEVADEISVTLNDERKFEATLVGKDERKDLALIVFETNEEVAVSELGDSEQLHVGDWALAVGNPMGLQSTVTAGIISALGREGGPNPSNIVDYIQTDAAINPGNSGGALVNIYGQVIGINSWIYSTTGTYTGYGFAIPINNAKKAIDDFINYGKAEYGWLGVSIMDPGEEFKEQMELPAEDGAFVSNVFKGSPAQKGGILPGDYIIKLNGMDINGTRHLTTLIGDLSPKDTQEFVLIRQGKEITLRIKLAIRKEEREIAKNNKNLWPGLNPVPLTDSIRNRFDIPDSVQGLILDRMDNESPGKIAGFTMGDVILKINNQKISTLKDFYAAINGGKSDEIMIKFWRDGVELIIGLVR
jgi:Do/DeqQ family serine protease